MTNDIATIDDMKSVERWENEGGRVTAVNNLWASLNKFASVDNSRERQSMDVRESPQHRLGVFSKFNLRRVV